jgi:hypothetical protein
MPEVSDVGGGDRRVAFVHGVLDRGRAFGRVARAIVFRNRSE